VVATAELIFFKKICFLPRAECIFLSIVDNLYISQIPRWTLIKLLAIKQLIYYTEILVVETLIIV